MRDYHMYIVGVEQSRVLAKGSAPQKLNLAARRFPA